MYLIWKVGKTYHLCGEGVETEILTAVAGESFGMFLPVFDIAEGVLFVTDGWSQPEPWWGPRSSEARREKPRSWSRRRFVRDEGQPES